MSSSRTGATPRVLCTQVAMGDYRQVFLEELAVLAEGRHDYRFLVGREYFEGSVLTGVHADSVEVDDRNRFVLGRRLLWQTGVVKRSLQADVAIVELNPRILSTWSVTPREG